MFGMVMDNNAEVLSMDKIRPLSAVNFDSEIRDSRGSSLAPALSRHRVGISLPTSLLVRCEYLVPMHR